MSAKAYREKVVMPFLEKVYDIFKKVVGFTKKYFVELMDVTEKNNNMSKINRHLKEENMDLKETINEIEKEKEELYDFKKKLGYFKIFLRKDIYNEIIEMGEKDKTKIKKER